MAERLSRQKDRKEKRITTIKDCDGREQELLTSDTKKILVQKIRAKPTQLTEELIVLYHDRDCMEFEAIAKELDRELEEVLQIYHNADRNNIRNTCWNNRIRTDYEREQDYGRNFKYSDDAMQNIPKDYEWKCTAKDKYA